MDTTALKQNLLKSIEKFEVIDCHEHLRPEKVRLEKKVDVFTFFSHYCHWDLLTAGMPDASYQALYNHNLPLDYRWDSFEPYWENIRYGCYATTALISAKKFYGVDDINRKTYRALSEAIQKNNTPGLYERVLKDACNIRTTLNQCGITDTESPLLTPILWIPLNDSVSSILDFSSDTPIRTLDDYIYAMKKWILKVKSEGVVALKHIIRPYYEPNRADALECFNTIMNGGTPFTWRGTGGLEPFTRRNPMHDYVLDEVFKFAGQQDMPIAVHAGVWGDFRELDPKHMIPVLTRHPNVRFDLYHLGYPYVRDTIMMGKSFPNVWVNLAWVHTVSKKATYEALDELIDTVPMNKILGFGGDYETPVEKAYGHLVMARDNIAGVLAGRVAAKHMTEDQALTIAKKWLFDNPVELYRLKF
ncbi:MAG: amidohydrolase family protein [bacterium]